MAFAVVLIFYSLNALGADSASALSDAWFPFNPPKDTFVESPMDLRFLNEKFAGEHGFISTKNGRFIHSLNNQPVRFWAVNGPSRGDSDPVALRWTARLLAKYGVNMVRRHGAVFDKDGEVNPNSVRNALNIVETMKEEGIYTHLSIYFPLWFTPRADHPWLKGYDGKTHPFAALMFNPAFQAKYREWWKALLTAPIGSTGKTLVDEPALFGVEVQNEDSFFFWTFDAKNIPDAQLRILEKMFGDWLVKKYGSLNRALSTWKDIQVKRDAPSEGRISFRPLWNIFNEKTIRDQDTTAFLFEIQENFYKETISYLRQLGFKGLITPSNWATASPEVFGPLEKLSYSTGDFIDRHGYFECNHKGDNAAWSIRSGHTYSDRSALRFDPQEPGKPRQIVHPVMDPHYDNKPSMISETTFCRPNRYRSEAPLYFAAYGALQNSDAIVHFAFDGNQWAVKPGFWMQQWTLMTPVMMGQFPATALLYRRGLVSSGPVLAEINLSRSDLLKLKGTPLPQDASLDELRLADVPTGTEIKPGQRIDPLIHYAGSVNVNFVNQNGSTKVSNLSPYIDHSKKTVFSASGELSLNYGKGILTVNAASAQGVSGALKLCGKTELKDITVSSDLDLGHILAVSLDNKPLAVSDRILLQVMSEEQETKHEIEQAGNGIKRVVNIGMDPWQVRALQGTIRFKRSDAGLLKVTALDFNGYPVRSLSSAQEIILQPTTLYYYIAR